MDKIAITGGTPLNGVIEISGAKNACLTLMPAALLTDQPLTLTNAPRLADIATMSELLASLGVEIASLAEGRVLALNAGEITSHTAAYDIVRKMRASILVLGPMLARDGHAKVSLPGGCAIGARPVDLHLHGLEQMGATLDTENLMMAATLAKGTTVLQNAAREPEIIDLAACLSAMGARIDGAGTSQITIEGVATLGGATHQVLADRVELGTYMIAPALAGGTVTLKGGSRHLVGALIDKLEEADIAVEDVPGGLKVSRRNGVIRPLHITTEPFPGFPTDLQAQIMAMLTLATGESVIEEHIFENRFMHVPELARMGAHIEVHGGAAHIHGVEALRGAPVMATDLRASVSLILAGLAAEGETVVSRVYHLDRGYERVEQKLGACGARIERITET
jgi:UDP-N-acetylglucosamine 1-carboxyvinyltransferase